MNVTTYINTWVCIAIVCQCCMCECVCMGLLCVLVRLNYVCVCVLMSVWEFICESVKRARVCFKVAYVFR